MPQPVARSLRPGRTRRVARMHAEAAARQRRSVSAGSRFGAGEEEARGALMRAVSAGRRFGTVLIAGLIGLCPQPGGADEPTLMKKTYVYKTVGPTRIEADVYRVEDGRVQPVV